MLFCGDTAPTVVVSVDGLGVSTPATHVVVLDWLQDVAARLGGAVAGRQ